MPTTCFVFIFFFWKQLGNSPLLAKHKWRTNPKDVIEREDAVARVLSVRSAARDFAMDRMLLTENIEGRKRQEGTFYTNVNLRKLAFPPNMEKALADPVKQLANMFHGFWTNRCRSLA